jgi:preprotein translocase subunit SecA
MTDTAVSLPRRLLRAVFGTRNERLLKKMRKTVETINAHEPQLAALSDEELRAKTLAYQQRHAAGESLEDLLPEAFATVREASKRALNMRHFDVQMLGGIVLHEGRIAEMRTGEGKTLVATLPTYLNALAGRGVHVITVNDYLATRDAEWIGKVYRFLGLSVGVVVSGLPSEARRDAYAADITYGTNNEFGFDYLRDNMVFSKDQRVQRDLVFAVVDEVDSILIDEARTPLIISGPADDRSEGYTKVNALIPKLTRQPEEEGDADYWVDEKARQVHLTERGHEQVEELLTGAALLGVGESLYGAANIGLMHHLNAALRAHALFTRDVDYVLRDGQVVIVDEFTGRTMPGRRWSEGLHQAVEAKEGVAIQLENQTLASITYQNYFRLYEKISGMTGTADTEAYEFQQIYGLEVVVVPTHRPMVRQDFGDVVFLTTNEKYQAIVEDIKDCRQRRQPVLVGTASIESSEFLSDFLRKEGIAHEVLNAKFHEKEAHIVAQAGRPGSVTVATNMAGRGTDIVLGGSLDAELAALPATASETDREGVRTEWAQRHAEVISVGGLHIVGTERHESRRIDNQLRGRAGRQGDPGSSRFYLSLQDNLMRIFASERVAGLMQKLGMQEGEAIEHPWVSKAIENAQRKVEARNFDMRKQLLEFDDVANDQRKHVYEQRRDLMESEDISGNILGIRHDVLNQFIDNFVPPQSYPENWKIDGLEHALHSDFGLHLPITEWFAAEDDLSEANLRLRLEQAFSANYAEKEQQVGADVMREFERSIMLQVLDSHWKEHLAAMDQLRQGIHLRGYAQKDPKQEYKRESFDMFARMLQEIMRDVIGIISKVEIRARDDVAELEEQRRRAATLAQTQIHESADALAPPPVADADPGSEPYVRAGRKVGRNDPCPCGSGRKFKQCHGKLN